MFIAVGSLITIVISPSYIFVNALRSVIVWTVVTLSIAIAGIWFVFNFPLSSKEARPLAWLLEDINVSICACVFVPMLDNDVWSICSKFEAKTLADEFNGQ